MNKLELDTATAIFKTYADLAAAYAWRARDLLDVYMQYKAMGLASAANEHYKSAIQYQNDAARYYAKARLAMPARPLPIGYIA